MERGVGGGVVVAWGNKQEKLEKIKVTKTNCKLRH